MRQSDIPDYSTVNRIRKSQLWRALKPSMMRNMGRFQSMLIDLRDTCINHTITQSVRVIIPLRPSLLGAVLCSDAVRPSVSVCPIRAH